MLGREQKYTENQPNVVSFEDDTYEARQGNRLPHEIAKASLGPNESWEYFNDNPEYDIESTPECYSLALLHPNYYFLMKPKGNFTLETNVMYFEILDKGQIKYTLKTPAGKKIEHIMENFNIDPELFNNSNPLDVLEENRQDILAYVTAKKHNELPVNRMKPNKIYISRNNETGNLSYTIKRKIDNLPSHNPQAEQQIETKDIALNVETDIEAPDFLTSIDQLDDVKIKILSNLKKNNHIRIFDRFTVHQNILCTRSTLITGKPIRMDDVRIMENEIGCIRDTDGKLRYIPPGLHRFTPGQYIGKANINDEHIEFGNYLHVIRVKPRSAKYAESNNKHPKLLTEGLHIIESPTLKVRDVIDLYGLEVRIQKTPQELALEQSLKPGAPQENKKEFDADGNEKSTKSNEKPIKQHIQLFQWIPTGNFIVAFDSGSKMRIIKGPTVIAIPEGWIVIKRMSSKEESKKFTITAKTKAKEGISERKDAQAQDIIAQTKDGYSISVTGKGVVIYQIVKPEDAITRFGPNKIEEIIGNKSRRELELYVNAHTYDELMTKSTTKTHSVVEPQNQDGLPPSYDDAMSQSVKSMQKNSGFGEEANACVRFISLELESVTPTFKKVAEVLEDTDATLVSWNRKIEVQEAELRYLQREPQLEELRQNEQANRLIRQKESMESDLVLAEHAANVVKNCANDTAVKVYLHLRQNPSTMFHQAQPGSLETPPALMSPTNKNPFTG